LASTPGSEPLNACGIRGWRIRGVSLVDRAGRSIDREGRRYRVCGSVPGAVEAHARVTSAGGDASVVAFVGDGDIGPALGFIAIPQYGRSLFNTALVQLSISITR
jgi:hypothetical protein